MRRGRLSAVAALNRGLEPQGLRLCINRDRRVDRGFFYIERIDTREIVRRNVDLRELGRSLRAHGTLPPPRQGEFHAQNDAGAATLLSKGKKSATPHLPPLAEL
jgi:hypothetical protein